MKNFSKQVLFILILALVISKSQAQTIPTIGTTAGSFVLFTNAGALTNVGASKVTGNIGTNAGAYSGFNPTILFGESEVANGVSAAAVPEVSAAYDSFNAITCTSTLTSPLGAGQILSPGVYCLGGETALTGDLILDAALDPNAIFIIKINGALSTAGLSNIVLINGAQVSNVYWQIGGAFTTGASSTFLGTVVAAGAIELLEASIFQGKALTTAGAITLHNNIVNTDETPLPVTLTKFNVEKVEDKFVSVAWSTVSEENSERFEVERSATGKEWNSIGTLAAKGESSVLTNYVFTDQNALAGVNYYRLKMIDKDQTFAYSRIRSIELKPLNSFVMYPNPTVSSVTIRVDNIEQIKRIQLIDFSGRSVYDMQKLDFLSLDSYIDMKNYPSGPYVARITGLNGVISMMRVVKL